MDKNSIRIDVVIPSIRADMEQILSMLQLNVPPNVKLCYYIISDRESLSSKDFVYKNSPVRVIINPKNLGAPLSRNVGLDIGTGDYVFFIDDDVVPAPNILYDYVTAIEKTPDASGYVGPTKFPTPVNSFTKGICASGILTFFEIPDERKWTTWGTTSNLLISRKNIGDIRFSDIFPKHGGGEDVDFCLRILEKNKKWYKIVHSATVQHNWWGNARRSYKRFFRWSFGDSVLPDIHKKYRYYDFPNMIEMLIIGMPIFTILSSLGVISSNFIIFWFGFVILSEFAIDVLRVRYIRSNSSIINSIESTIIEFSLDLGKLLGRIRRKRFPFFTRFDYFGTSESVPFERKISIAKFVAFFSGIFYSYWV